MRTIDISTSAFKEYVDVLIDRNSFDVVVSLANIIDLSKDIKDVNDHDEQALCYSFSHDSKHVAVGYEDQTIRLWNAMTGNCVHIFDKFTEAIWSCSFSSNDKHLLCESYDSLLVWQIESRRMITHFITNGTKTEPSSFSPNGKYILVILENSFEVWDVETSEVIFYIDYCNQKISISFTLDSARILVFYNKIEMWEIETDRLLNSVRIDQSTSCSFSHDKRYTAVCSRKRSINIYCVQTEEHIRTFEGKRNQIAISRSVLYGRNTVIRVPKKELKFLCPDTGTLKEGVVGHTGEIVSSTFSSDGKLILTCSEDRTAKIWLVSIGMCLKSLEGHQHEVLSGSFSSDGRYVITRGEMEVKLWSVDSGKCLKTFNNVTISFSPDSNFAITLDNNTSIVQIWDLNTIHQV